MLRLVETYIASAGQSNVSDRTPSGLLHLRTPDALRPERQYLRLEVVTHQIKFVPGILVGGMDRYFCRRQREDQPSMASVYRRKSEDVPQESAISRRILTVHNYMRTKDYDLALLPPIIRDKPSPPQSGTGDLSISDFI